MFRFQKQSIPDLSNMMSHKVNTEGAVFVVHRQPIALDRFTIHDVRPPDASGKNTCMTEQHMQHFLFIIISLALNCTETLKLI